MLEVGSTSGGVKIWGSGGGSGNAYRAKLQKGSEMAS